MIHKLIASMALFGSLFCPDALSGQVTLKNGDRLTGTILKTDGENLSVKSDYAGEVKIQWAAVEQIVSDQPLHITAKDGQVLIGTVTTAGGGEVQTRDAGKVALAKKSIAFLRSREEQIAYEAEIERRRNPGWLGTVDAGLSTTRGNAETIVISLGTQAARTTPDDKLSVYAASLFARSITSGTALTTAQALRGGARYRNINDRLLGFTLTDLESDKFQQLDLRLVLSGGLGWHVRRSERTRLDLFAGGSFNQEFFSTGLRRKFGEALFGEELSLKLSDRISLAERAVIYPNLSDFGEYRLAFDSSVGPKLPSRLPLQATLSDRFLSNPIPGIKKNDLLLTTGIRLSFGESPDTK